MLDTFKSWLRPVKYGYLRWRAERLADRPGPHDQVPTPAPIVFLFGCGRSGTTVLGRVFSRHPHVFHLREPGYLWAAIDRETDFTNFYDRVQGRCLMDAAHAGPQARVRFARLMLSPLRRSGKELLFEKTPINALRIGYLEALAPDARFMHIVRDGVDVCRSIDRIATANTYRIAGKPTHNQWWGLDDIKWDALARDGVAAGYYEDQVGELHSHLAKGAYEWLVTQREVDRWRDALGDRLFELRYSDLTADPRAVLGEMCAFLGLDAPPAWLDAAAEILGPGRHNEGATVVLPPSMCRAFNAYQERFGFAGRAVDAAGATT